MNGWQPIKTAPKDGTVVLFFDPKYLVVTGQIWWSKELQKHLCIADCQSDELAIGRLDDYDYPPAALTPTLWMPLPAPLA